MPGNNRKNAGRRRREPAPAGSSGVAPGPEPHAGIPGDPTTIRWLNTILKNELTAIDQYFLHSRMFGDWGLSNLAKHEYEESVDEMKHADSLIKRILFLGGLPNLQDLGKLMIGENVREVLECDLSLEMLSYPDLKNAIVHCESIRDYVSRELLVRILESEEEHIDYLQTQMRLIEQMGLQNYVQLQSKPNESGT
ncbi:MAG TPA: bacterioferritin [Rhizomicrobium sp.]|nr:bacterioferritin [Rhizomicrobium sp.]